MVVNNVEIVVIEKVEVEPEFAGVTGYASCGSSSVAKLKQAAALVQGKTKLKAMQSLNLNHEGREITKEKTFDLPRGGCALA